MRFFFFFFFCQEAHVSVVALALGAKTIKDMSQSSLLWSEKICFLLTFKATHLQRMPTDLKCTYPVIWEQHEGLAAETQKLNVY